MLRLSAATYRKQGSRPSHTDHKLQTLLLRCQGLIYLRLYKVRETELRRVQRQAADLKTQVGDAEWSGARIGWVALRWVRLGWAGLGQAR